MAVVLNQLDAGISARHQMAFLGPHQHPGYPTGTIHGDAPQWDGPDGGVGRRGPGVVTHRAVNQVGVTDEGSHPR